MKSNSSIKSNKLKKILLIISLGLNIFFVFMIIFGLISDSKNKNSTQCVNAQGSQIVETLVGSKWQVTPGDQTSYDMSSGTLEYNLYFYMNSTYTTVYDGLRFQKGASGLDIDARVLVSQTYVSVYNHSSGFNLSSIDIFDLPTSDTENNKLITWFSTYFIYSGSSPTLEASVFTFQRQINYNAPFGYDINSAFVSYNGSNYQLEYSFGWFKSNNEVYDRIRLRFIDGENTRYKDNNIVRLNNATNTAYYMYMEYYNSMSNTSKMVNQRTYEYVYDNGNTQVCLVNGSTWVNTEYQILRFYFSMTNEEENYLSQFNTSNYQNGFTEVANDVGLTNVFVLVGDAFKSFGGIFAIQLLPGITIGLLFFMPLIVGIILTIIWLVKR